MPVESAESADQAEQGARFRAGSAENAGKLARRDVLWSVDRRAPLAR